jgi:hypothetical protein
MLSRTQLSTEVTAASSQPSDKCGAYVRRRKTGFLRWVAFATFLTIHALRVRRSAPRQTREPTVHHRTVVVVPQPRYEVILVSEGCPAPAARPSPEFVTST